MTELELYQMTMTHLIVGYTTMFCFGALAATAVIMWWEDKHQEPIAPEVLKEIMRREHIVETQERSERR